MKTNDPAPGMALTIQRSVRDQPNDADPEGEAAPVFPGGLTESEVMRISRDAYSSSTDYFDANFRRGMETSLRYFDGRHAPDSKYYKDAYKHRSKGFRPKSRSMSRKLEAQSVAAFFSNPELADIDALNQDDPQAVATAAMLRQLLSYRLQYSIPAFLTIVGGVQDAIKTGVVCSYNYWMYKTRTKVRTVEVPVPGMMDVMGQPMTLPQEEEYEEVVADKPCIELVPLENLRFSPNAKWYDVINTSPYLIRIVPMYVSQVRERMTRPDKYGRVWRDHSEEQIIAATKRGGDSTRQTRLGRRQDPVDNSVEPSDFEVVEAYEWIVERPDGDVVWWTIGTELLVQDPMPIEDVYLHGKRPLTMGYINLETHKVVPTSLIGIAAPIQRELNELTNERRDNVKLVLNRQWFVRAGKNIDTTNLMNGVPGGVTHMQDPEKDVIGQEWQDVTASGYQEQDRLNGDYDELTGSFSASSIMANRRLNETVGGLELLGEGANALSEYSLRTFSETWLIPTLRQLVLLEQYYETDEKIMMLAGERASQAYRVANAQDPQMAQAVAQVPIQAMIDRMIDEEVVVRLRVGMNATDPNRKLLRFALAMRNLKEFAATPFPGANYQEIGKEIMTLLGYGDGKRFFDGTQTEMQVMMLAQNQVTLMLSEAEKAAKAVLEAADDRMNKAESAEEAARSAHLTLVKYENTLMERFITQALRELKFEKDRELAEVAANNEQTNLENERRLSSIEIKGEKDALSAKKANGAKSEKGEKGDPVQPINISVNMPKGGGTKRVEIARGPDGVMRGRSSSDD